MRSNWLTAGHAPRRFRQPVAPQLLAARIVASIKEHAALGIVRQPGEYTQRPETLALIKAALALGCDTAALISHQGGEEGTP